MELYTLILGIALILVFAWFFMKSVKRYGFPKSLMAIDIIIGLIAGFYLLISSIHHLIFGAVVGVAR
jgi:flagellar biogenesis protein FliO